MLIMVFCVMTLCILVATQGTCRDDGGNMFNRNLDNYIPDYTVSHLTRQQSTRKYTFLFVFKISRIIKAYLLFLMCVNIQATLI
jgi:hypothetical protein